MFPVVQIASVIPWYLSLCGLAAIFGGLFADAQHQITKGNLGAFPTYYHAAAALKDGRNPYGLIEGVYAYVYPPFFAAIDEPLTGMPIERAARVALSVNLLMIAASMILLANVFLRRLNVESSGANVMFVALCTTALVSVPIHNELRGMETNSLMLLSFTLALYWLDRWPILSGLALAVSIDVKYLPIVMIPYLLLRRRWKVASTTIAWTIGLALLPAIWLGWSANLDYLRDARRGLAGLSGAPAAAGSARVHGVSDSSSLSITSALTRLGAESGSKVLGILLVLAVVGACAAAVAILYRRYRLPSLRCPSEFSQRQWPYRGLLAIEWAGVVTAAMVFSPNTQNRNLVLAAFVATLLVVVLCAAERTVERTLFSLVSLILFLALMFPIAGMGHRFTERWVSGGVACWCVLAVCLLSVWGGLQRVARGDRTSSSAVRVLPLQSHGITTAA